MAVKWKIFRILNLIQLIYGIGFFLFITFNMFRRGYQADDFPFLSIPLGFFFMACNNYLNLFILSNFFPNKSLPLSFKRLHTASFVISLLFSIALAILLIPASIEEFGDGQNSSLWDGKIVIVCLFFILGNWVYVLIMQVKLKQLIRKRYEMSLQQLLDSIGQQE